MKTTDLGTMVTSFVDVTNLMRKISTNKKIRSTLPEKIIEECDYVLDGIKQEFGEELFENFAG